MRFTEWFAAIPRASGSETADGGLVDGGGEGLGKSIQLQLTLQYPSCKRLQTRMSVSDDLLFFFKTFGSI